MVTLIFTTNILNMTMEQFYTIHCGAFCSKEDNNIQSKSLGCDNQGTLLNCRDRDIHLNLPNDFRNRDREIQE